MKNTIKLLGLIALVALIGFSLASCVQDEEENDTKTLAAGIYATTDSPGVVNTVGDPNNVVSAVSALTAVTSPSFTVGADGVITALSLGQGGSAFLIWIPGSGSAQYRFTLDGPFLNFQVKRSGAQDFVNWNPNPATLNGVAYNQSIYGTLLSETGNVQLRLEYKRTDNSGTVDRTYELKKQ